jgi:hypothetical protein
MPRPERVATGLVERPGAGIRQSTDTATPITATDRQPFAAKTVEVASIGVVDAGDWPADAGGQDHFVIAFAKQVIRRDAGVQAQVDAGGLQLAAEVAQGFEKLFLARNALGDVELPADFAGRVEQRYVVPALGRTVAARPAGPLAARFSDPGDRQSSVSWRRALSAAAG